MGAYSYYIVCMIITVCLSRSMLASDIGFPIYVTCINMLDALLSFSLPLYEHADARRIHRHETLPDFRHENGASLLLHSYSESLVRIAFCVL